MDAKFMWSVNSAYFHSTLYHFHFSFLGRATGGLGQHRKVRLTSCGADEDAPGTDLEETRARLVRAGPHAAPKSGTFFAACFSCCFSAYNWVLFTSSDDSNAIIFSFHFAQFILTPLYFRWRGTGTAFWTKLWWSTTWSPSAAFTRISASRRWRPFYVWSPRKRRR